MTPRGRFHVHYQLLVFLVVGLASAVIDAGVFLLLNRLGVPPAPASAAGFCTAFAVNYRGNRDVVFKAGRVPRALRRYIVLVAGNLSVSTGGVAGLVAAGVPPFTAKLSTMVLVAAINFVMLRRWVFALSGPTLKQHHPDRPGQRIPDQPAE